MISPSLSLQLQLMRTKGLQVIKTPFKYFKHNDLHFITLEKVLIFLKLIALEPATSENMQLIENYICTYSIYLIWSHISPIISAFNKYQIQTRNYSCNQHNQLSAAIFQQELKKMHNRKEYFEHQPIKTSSKKILSIKPCLKMAIL